MALLDENEPSYEVLLLLWAAAGVLVLFSRLIARRRRDSDLVCLSGSL